MTLTAACNFARSLTLTRGVHLAAGATMYVVNDKESSSYHRAPLGPELKKACPTCDQPKGTACVIALWRSGTDVENTQLPHNKRYLAAKMDPYVDAASDAA